jgi:hypothetical protein
LHLSVKINKELCTRAEGRADEVSHDLLDRENKARIIAYKTYDSTGEQQGGHAVFLDRYDHQQQTFVGLNSWGDKNPTPPVKMEDVMAIYDVEVLSCAVSKGSYGKEEHRPLWGDPREWGHLDLRLAKQNETELDGLKMELDGLRTELRENKVERKRLQRELDITQAERDELRRQLANMRDQRDALWRQVQQLTPPGPPRDEDPASARPGAGAGAETPGRILYGDHELPDEERFTGPKTWPAWVDESVRKSKPGSLAFPRHGISLELETVKTKPMQRPPDENKQELRSYLARPRSVTPSGQKRSKHRYRSPDRPEALSLSPGESMRSNQTRRVTTRSPRSTSPPYTPTR